MSQVAVATISIDALKHNLLIVQKFVPQSKILAVVKADAYGHGLLTVATALRSVDAFAVAHVEEALNLREHLSQKSIDKRIVLLQGFLKAEELSLLLSHCVDPVIHSFYQIDILEQFTLPENFSVWLKVDTGMNRLGIAADKLSEAWGRLNQIKNLRHRIKLMSHFANADDVTGTASRSQIDRFHAIAENCQMEPQTERCIEKSLANSAGIIQWQQSHYQWVRPGIMLYGVSPFVDKQAVDLGLKPVMTFQSQIIAINELKKNQCVGYGSRWCAKKNTHIAVVACGYGDGYPRHVKENTPVLINGQTYPIVGRVSMDMICVNLGNTDCVSQTQVGVNIGDAVVLWGNGLPVEKVARQADTIAYELLCQLTSRVQFKTIQ